MLVSSFIWRSECQLSALISDLGDRSSYVIDEGRVLSFAAIHLSLRAISQGRRPAAITK